MKTLLSNLNVQVAWRYFLAWLWPIPLGAAIFGHLDAGIILATIIFFTNDWRNAPYKGPFTGYASTPERLKSASFFIALWVAIYLAIHLILPHGERISLTSLAWLSVAAMTIIIISFTKPLLRKPPLLPILPVPLPPKYKRPNQSISEDSARH
jgi:hypothetical protein